MDLTLNNLQRFICYRNQTTDQQTWTFFLNFLTFFFMLQAFGWIFCFDCCIFTVYVFLKISQILRGSGRDWLFEFKVIVLIFSTIHFVKIFISHSWGILILILVWLDFNFGFGFWEDEIIFPVFFFFFFFSRSDIERHVLQIKAAFLCLNIVCLKLKSYKCNVKFRDTHGVNLRSFTWCQVENCDVVTVYDRMVMYRDVYFYDKTRRKMNFSTNRFQKVKSLEAIIDSAENQLLFYTVYLGCLLLAS